MLITGLRPEIVKLAAAMQFKLEKNAQKKGWPEADDKGNRGWKDPENLQFLKMKLMEEVGELFEAIKGDDLEKIHYEAADIANMAMMIADNRGALLWPHQQ